MTNFKKKRLEADLSQNKLARDSGVSRWKVWAHEQGDYRLTPDEAERIQQALRREALRLRAISQNLDSPDEVSA